jgi:hypothetical protein
MEKKFKTYQGPNIKLGIDNLKNEHPWRGNSQGDYSWSDELEVGLASEGWMSFMFDGIDMYDEEAVQLEILRRKKYNRDYIKQLKRDGKYGKEIEGVKFTLVEHSLYDRVKERPLTPSESYKMTFIDFSK